MLRSVYNNIRNTLSSSCNNNNNNNNNAQLCKTIITNNINNLNHNNAIINSNLNLSSQFIRNYFIRTTNTIYNSPLTKEQKESLSIVEQTPNKANIPGNKLMLPKKYRSPLEKLHKQKQQSNKDNKDNKLNVSDDKDKSFKFEIPADIFPDPIEPFISTARRVVSRAVRRSIQISPQKLNDICRLVRGLSVNEAITQLKFSQKRKAEWVLRAIRHAAIMGINNFGMNKNRLYVSNAWVGPGTHLKRIDIKGRGRQGIKRRYYSHLFIKVREQPSELQPHDKKLFGMKIRKQGFTHKYGIETRIGRYGRKITTIQRQEELVKVYKQTKLQLGLKKHQILPLPRKTAVVTDFNAPLTQMQKQSESTQQKQQQTSV